MKLVPTHLSGLFVVQADCYIDPRGTFVKYFADSVYSERFPDLHFVESFYSVSKRNVLRGMHLQVPPHDHIKLVQIIKGEVLDVVVDLRKDSPTCGGFYAMILRPGEGSVTGMLIDKGLAHGFLSLTDDSVLHYSVTTEHNPKYDTGIRFDSFGCSWETQMGTPVVSDRDLSLPRMEDVLAR